MKQVKYIKKLGNYAKKIKNYLLIKFIIYFIFSFILLFFFLYFITCFCAVYTNTQMILIKDTLISFGISMLYPIGLNLLPGIFRIPSLRTKKKKMENVFLK